jgi:hypothetical protein
LEKKKSVYIETTIPSYATSRPSIDLIIAGRQILTMRFWENERQKYHLFTSQFVWDECSQGDPEAAKRRLEFIKGIPLLLRNDAIDTLAETYFDFLEIPERAKADCFHLAVCVKAEIDYLLSWNCSHLGQVSYGKMCVYNDKHGLWIPKLVTPEVLMEIEEEERGDIY